MSALARWPRASAAEDPRALTFDGAGIYKGLGFLATTAPSAANASFDINITVAAGSGAYNLSIYTVDFEGDGCSCAAPPQCCETIKVDEQCAGSSPGRAQRVSILDSSGAALAPAQELRAFGGGVYIRYRLSGSVVVRVSQMCGQRGDAMVNAIFFDQ